METSAKVIFSHVYAIIMYIFSLNLISWAIVFAYFQGMYKGIIPASLG